MPGVVGRGKSRFSGTIQIQKIVFPGNAWPESIRIIPPSFGWGDLVGDSIPGDPVDSKPVEVTCEVVL